MACQSVVTNVPLKCKMSIRVEKGREREEVIWKSSI
jgi:hypothetical protein